MSAHRTNDLSGKVFGRLTVIRFHSKDRHYNQKYACRCECGSEAIVPYGHLTHGHTKSCGCLHKERTSESHITHGLYHGPGGKRSRLSRVWSTMKDRCFNHNCKAFQDYGGRGVSVCDAWLEFKTFHDWAIANGYKEGLSIDRMDNDKGYSPENCQWATRKTQSRNKRTTIVISHKGKTMKLVEWAEHLRVKPSMLRLRIKRGWTIDKVLYVKEKGARI